MAAQPAVKPQMLSAASTASQQDVIKENYEKVGEGFRLAKKKKKKVLYKEISALTFLFFDRKETL